MIEIPNLVRPSIRTLKPYSSARDEFEGEASVWLDANENPFNNGLNRYPDPHQKELKWTLAKQKEVMPNQVFFGNGSDEIIDLLMRAFCEPGQDSVLQFSPTYGMYEVSAGINNVSLLDVPLTAEFQLDIEGAKRVIQNEKPKLIFVCSPNNPTGNLIARKTIEELLKSNAIVVIDEAYSDFASESWVKEIDNYTNLVVLQTFSKARGMAGIRLGMAFANPEILAVLDRIKPPYNVNILTQQTAMKGLESLDKSVITTLVEERKKLEAELPKLPQVVKMYPSEANFLLVEFKDAKSTYDMLVKTGIVVRDRSGQVANTLRITVGTPSENERLIEVLSGKWIDKKSERIGTVKRTTSETDILVEVNLDSNKNTSIETGLGFFDHMLDQVSKHGKIGLKVEVMGDLHIDEHHTIEDTALALGEAFLKALGDKKGIERYGYLLPMDDCLAQVALDFGGRPWLVWETEFKREKVGELPTELFYHFFKSFSDAAKCNLNVKAEGDNEHHKIEAIFKAFARAMKMAVKKEGDELPSTKGVL
jgi:histidinol-phosphate aminotransferase